MSAGLPHRGPVPSTPGHLSRWMVRRDARLRRLRSLWWLTLGMATVIGLLDWSWLWLPVAVAATNMVAVVGVWWRVWHARRRTVRDGWVHVVGVLPRGVVRRTEAVSLAGWDDELTSGDLEAVPGGWLWRPGRIAGQAFRQLHLPAASVAATGWLACRGYGPLLPPAAYLRLITRGGEQVEFLVWDYPRLPPGPTPPPGDPSE